MTLNAWLDNWQRCSHTSDTSLDIHSYFMISASFNSRALTRVIWQRVVCISDALRKWKNEISSSVARSNFVWNL